MLDATVVLALVGLTVGVGHQRFTVGLALDPEALTNCVAGIHSSTCAIRLSIFELTFVERAISEDHPSFALPRIVVPVALIAGASRSGPDASALPHFCSLASFAKIRGAIVHLELPYLAFTEHLLKPLIIEHKRTQVLTNLL